MRIVHFSDWHGRVVKLPEADIYVCTGDMFEDNWIQTYNGWQPDYTSSNKMQSKFLGEMENPREKYFSSVDAPLAWVRGNHCFLEDAASYFGGETYEIGNEATSFTIKGLKFGGFRGTKYIAPGFSDGLKDSRQLGDALDEDLDIVMTHAPPRDVLDIVMGHGGSFGVGMVGLRNYIDKSNLTNNHVRLSLFGHIHEEFGTERLGNILCCNSAVGYTVLEGNYDQEWQVIESRRVYDDGSL